MPETEVPFTTFRFSVEIRVDGVAAQVCHASFCECDGLEMSMQPKTIREGGNNARPIHLAGPAAFGQLTLKRGLTSTLDLWNWFEKVVSTNGQGYRTDVWVYMKSSDGQRDRIRFQLTNCLPVKMKFPRLSAMEGVIAIEEMQLVYETLSISPPEA